MSRRALKHRIVRTLVGTILVQYFDERVGLCAVRVAPQDVPHSPVLFVVPGIERKPVGPPVIGEPFRRDEFPPVLGIELHQLGIESAPCGIDPDSHGPRIDFCNAHPRRGEMETAFCLCPHLAGEIVPGDAELCWFGVVHNEKIVSQNEHQKNEGLPDPLLSEELVEALHFTCGMAAFFGAACP